MPYVFPIPQPLQPIQGEVFFAVTDLTTAKITYPVARKTMANAIKFCIIDE